VITLAGCKKKAISQKKSRSFEASKVACFAATRNGQRWFLEYRVPVDIELFTNFEYGF